MDQMPHTATGTFESELKNSENGEISPKDDGLLASRSLLRTSSFSLETLVFMLSLARRAGRLDGYIRKCRPIPPPRLYIPKRRAGANLKVRRRCGTGRVATRSSCHLGLPIIISIYIDGTHSRQTQLLNHHSPIPFLLCPAPPIFHCIHPPYAHLNSGPLQPLQPHGFIPVSVRANHLTHCIQIRQCQLYSRHMDARRKASSYDFRGRQLKCLGSMG